MSAATQLSLTLPLIATSTLGIHGKFQLYALLADNMLLHQENTNVA
jgi:hypothetical protein